MAMAKNILGLDLGTNSIGWALVEINFLEKKKSHGIRRIEKSSAYSLIVICNSKIKKINEIQNNYE